MVFRRRPPGAARRVRRGRCQWVGGIARGGRPASRAATRDPRPGLHVLSLQSRAPFRAAHHVPSETPGEIRASRDPVRHTGLSIRASPGSHRGGFAPPRPSPPGPTPVTVLAAASSTLGTSRTHSPVRSSMSGSNAVRAADMARPARPPRRRWMPRLPAHTGDYCENETPVTRKGRSYGTIPAKIFRRPCQYLVSKPLSPCRPGAGSGSAAAARASRSPTRNLRPARHFSLFTSQARLSSPWPARDLRRCTEF